MSSVIVVRYVDRLLINISKEGPVKRGLSPNFTLLVHKNITCKICLTCLWSFL